MLFGLEFVIWGLLYGSILTVFSVEYVDMQEGTYHPTRKVAPTPPCIRALHEGGQRESLPSGSHEGGQGQREDGENYMYLGDKGSRCPLAATKGQREALPAKKQRGRWGDLYVYL